MKRPKHKPFAIAKVRVRNYRTGKEWYSTKPMKVFIDSGASISILPPQALAILEKGTGHFDKVSARVQTANGIKDAFAIKKAGICLNESCFQGNVLISDGINGDVLIGSDFLTKAGCTVDFKKKTMRCKGRQIQFRMEG